MNKQLTFRIHPLLVAVLAVGGLLALLLGAYGLTRLSSQDEVIGKVTVAGTEVGGLTRDQAMSTVLGLEEQHQERQLGFVVADQTVLIVPSDLGLDIDEDEVVDEAMALGRDGNGPYQFLWWVSHLFKTEHLALIGSVDEDSLQATFDTWDAVVIGEPPSPGSIVIEDGEPTPVYPKTGTGVDRDVAPAIIERNLLAEEPSAEVIPTKTVVPRLTDDDVDVALGEARRLLGEPIRLIYDSKEIVFTPEQLTAAYQALTATEETPHIQHTFDPTVIDEYLQPVREQYEAEPVDARFSIGGDRIEILAGRKGTRIDETETANKLVQAGLTSGRVGTLPLVEDADPEVTTEDLEALGIKHLVSSFTTYHDCCADRVTNIHIMADAVDMAIVRPGQEFSLNDFVGQRTEEKGYLPAGTIVGGELIDTVGGGVSQFATTMYNAIFYAALEDVQHSPHGWYFTRYPEGIEATVSWRSPELIWRNNTKHAVLVDTEYTDTSITIRIFGDNDGRSVRGEQTGGKTILNVLSKGGSDALWVQGTVSERFAFTDPPPPEYRGDPTFGLNQFEEEQSEGGGWTVTVTRRITRGGPDDVVAEETRNVVYRARRAIYTVHPCKVPGKEDTCPTTTTIPPSTTTIEETPTTD